MPGFNELDKALKRNDIYTFKKLIHDGIDINCRDSRKCTVLHHVAYVGWKEMIAYLASLGANVNATDNQGRTPLHYALLRTSHRGTTVLLEKEKIELLECLVQHGADINATFNNNATSLHEAVRLKNIKGIETLVGLGVQVDACKYTDWTAVILALNNDEMAVLKRLVELGADVNASYSVGTALYDAAGMGRVDILAILEQHGADVNAVNLSCITPVLHLVIENITNLKVYKCLTRLRADFNSKINIRKAIHEAVDHQNEDMLRYLAAHGADISAMRMTDTLIGPACEKNQLKKIECLLECGADINAQMETVPALIDAARKKDYKMMNLLVELGENIDNYSFSEDVTALYKAVSKSRRDVVEFLLKHGADVNMTFERELTTLHDAVKRGDTETVKMLHKLGADINVMKLMGFTVLHEALGKEESERDINIVKALIEGGADLNIGYNYGVKALHDAVRLADKKMVETLAHLGADMNCMKVESFKPLHHAIAHKSCWNDVIGYLAACGANLNVTCEQNVRPLHDAIKKGDTAMVLCLVNSGAHVGKFKSEGLTALHLARSVRDKELLKCLVKAGADINIKSTDNETFLHTAVQHSDITMCKLLCQLGSNILSRKIEMVSLLENSVNCADQELAECFINLGIDQNCTQNIMVTPIDDAIRLHKTDISEWLRALGADALEDTVGSTPLHTTCELSNIDLTRLLIITGSDVNKEDRDGKTPFELLQLRDTTDYHVLYEAATARNKTEAVVNDHQSVVLCQSIDCLPYIQGIGNMEHMPFPRSQDMVRHVNNLLQLIIDGTKIFSNAKLKGIGSASEGTKVGLPTDMDFLFQIELSTAEETNLRAGYGYQYMLHAKHVFKEGSKSFHNIFANDVQRVSETLQYRKLEENVFILEKRPIFRDSDRKACSPLSMMWKDDHATFYMSVDALPCVHVDNWPQGAISKTWLMDSNNLRKQGYLLVPKPPNVKSNLAKKFTNEELKTLWRISFAHLETEHMQRLEKRVKDVYVTAKCLRNPDVCRIMITDDGSLPRQVDKYITSYHLKMIFFKNIEDFLHSDHSLGEMVCCVYDDLENALSQGHIPLFFMPELNALDGQKLNVVKCAKVAKIMKKFVQALYLRDCQDDMTDSDECSAVYRTYEISS